MKRPKVTIAIPTFNRACYIGQAIESSLSQTYGNIEVLIADNASTDNTEEVVKRFKDPRIRYYKHKENKGLVFNWNFCLKHARGVFFLMLSDDDILENNAIEWLQSQFNEPSVVMANSSVEYINENSVPVKNFFKIYTPDTESGHDFIINRLKKRRLWLPSTTLHRTAHARKLGGYPPLGAVTDIALCFSLVKSGIVRYNPQPLVRYRIHEQNFSKASKFSISSHEDFVRWSSSPASPLYKYRKEIRRYCIYCINYMAYYEAQRGDMDLFCFAVETLRRLSPGLVQEFKIKLCLFPHFRQLVSIRRLLKGGLDNLFNTLAYFHTSKNDRKAF